MSTLSIERRFCGPPGCAHGGYLSGMLANHSNRQLRIRLLQPVPLQVALELSAADADGLELRLGAQRFARCYADELQLQVPPAPSYLEALEASRGFPGFARHAFPACFACGTQRARGDGLRIFPGLLPGTARVAATWVPDRSLAATHGTAQGKIRPEFMAAALDCPGYYAARQDAVPMLLGEFTAHVDRCVHVDEPCIVIGWKIGGSGRKYQVGTALFDEDGELCARASAVWIEPRAAGTG